MFKKSCGWFTVLLALALLGSCRTIPVEERAPARQAINDRARETIEKLADKHPDLQAQVNDAAGYFVGRVSGLKAPVVGAGRGLGVLYNQETLSRTYMDINRFDLGAGLGKGAYRVLALFPEREALEKFKAGVWKTGLSAEAGLSDTISTTVSELDAGLPVFILPEDGATLTATARLVRVSVNEDLTDTGVSEIGIPNTGLKTVGRQGNDAPRKWEHKLPFLAQRVIDLGYDLPLPYGIGLAVVNVNQDMLLGDLEVGINGRPEVPFKFVAFENGNAQNTSAQLKLDTWLFPFMNVFALVGSIDGTATLDVVLDGNDILAHLGATCPGLPPNPLCPILKDKEITLPIETDFSGTTYGGGMTLAGGWKNWFVALPVTVTYADMDTTDTEGLATTVTPRAGRTFNLGNGGNLSLYGGGNYLAAELTVKGQVSTPDKRLIIDYTVEQKNKDKWNLLCGGNWDINKRWSVAAEYNGFIGSREAVIMTITSRF